MERPEFEGFPKMARLNREIIITEKIDGTNAQILITEDGDVFPGSRTRWIRPGDDNAGFASWVEGHKAELITLGPGRHFGEWWGSGIQRGYGLKKGEKRFSLFNTSRWGHNGVDFQSKPDCCLVVPELYRGPFSELAIKQALFDLELVGSFAEPGFKNPEGIIVFHTAANSGFKVTLKDDESPKSLVK